MLQIKLKQYRLQGLFQLLQQLHSLREHTLAFRISLQLGYIPPRHVSPTHMGEHGEGWALQ